jgi:hypothetical protein
MHELTLDQQIDQVDHNMTNHAPSEQDIVDIEALRASAKILGHKIAAVCPHSREKSLAQTNLEQALMWAVASIVLRQETK